MRPALFLVFAVLILGGPIAEQTFGVRHPALRGWQMFGGVGMLSTQVRFFTVGADGAANDLDRFALLSPDKPPPTGRSRHVADAPAAAKIARALCRKLGKGADVRVELSKASKTGWRVVLDGTTNLCAAPAPKAAR